MGSLWIFIDIILPAALRPWGRLSLHRVLGIFRGGKGARCVGLTTLPPSCADCLGILGASTSWNLKTCPGLYRDCFLYLYLYLYDLKFYGMKMSNTVVFGDMTPCSLVVSLRHTTLHKAEGTGWFLSCLFQRELQYFSLLHLFRLL
jgi:hypothetical protein